MSFQQYLFDKIEFRKKSHGYLDRVKKSEKSSTRVGDIL